MADNDIQQIKKYIKYVLQNPIAANKIIDNLIKKILILEEFPLIGKNYNYYSSNERYIIYNKYLIFYEITPNKIIIKTIIHGKQNKRYIS